MILFIFKFLITKDITYKKTPKLLHTISTIFVINTTKHNWDYSKSFNWYFRYVIQLILVKKKETYLVIVNGANSSPNKWRRHKTQSYFPIVIIIGTNRKQTRSINLHYVNGKRNFGFQQLRRLHTGNFKVKNFTCNLIKSC